MPEVVILGAGVIGLSVAWRAAQRGLRVLVVDRGDPGAATSAVAAGMLAPISEIEPGEEGLFSLMRDSAQAYPAFVEELVDATGQDPGYRRCGTLLVARDADEAEALEREQQLRTRLGLEVDRLRPSLARQLEPALAPTIRTVLDIPGDHAIDPRRLTRALAVAAARAGAELRAGTEVAEVQLGRGRPPALRTTGGELLRAGRLVIAAGPWSGSIPGIPPEAVVPIRPVKGQTLRLRDPAGSGLLSRVIRMHQGYLVPRDDGRYVLGATMEEKGFDRTATAGAIYELLRDAIELVPGISELVVEELAVGLRPGTPDNRPVLGPGAVPGLHWATGHYRHGVLLAPITAELVVSALTGSEDPRAAAFGADRFAPLAAGGPA
jgi:glycine oxidase